jgi:hypothetical protein
MSKIKQFNICVIVQLETINNKFLSSSFLLLRFLLYYTHINVINDQFKVFSLSKIGKFNQSFKVEILNFTTSIFIINKRKKKEIFLF